MQQTGKTLLQACFIISWFLFVLFICHTCRPIGWVGLQLWVFIQTFSSPAGCTKEWKSMHFMSPSTLLSKSTTVMIRGVTVVNA